MINLISDTVTKPSKGMLDAMYSAKVGDDVFKEDPTVIQLEERLADMFKQEAALFCPSGTMANQIAIKAHTKPLDEMLCDISSHVYQFEVGGYAFHSQIAVNPIHGQDGLLNAAHIKSNIKAEFDWLPRTSLVVLENSANRAGGNVYEAQDILEISEICKSLQLKLHLDGARIFNAMIATGMKADWIGSQFDSISVCLSKGLGCPIGSVLIGSKEFIKESRRIRKVMGGGMRQVGILAAAGLYALDHNIERLKVDHDHAKQLESCLVNHKMVSKVLPVKTNIVIFQLKENWKADDFVLNLKKAGINSSAFGNNSLRWVTHLDITKEMINQTCDVMDQMGNKLS
ncbi:MAG: PLP-dependent transferase [Saprospiraceae bacterium]|nr:PLP-dependent transferase [Saprospiraceae bacterium]MBK9632691.1 PLP-dependent transferase [Saprospiraceae bacterium]